MCIRDRYRYLRSTTLAIVGVLWLAVAGSTAIAQVQVAAQTERTYFLLYERVDLLVTVANVGDTDLVLDNNEGHPWLSFLVSRHSQQNYLPVRPERDGNFPPVTLKAGENKTMRINLTPLFSFCLLYTSWFMLQRIRLAMQNGTIVKMGGEVEVDETFILSLIHI